MKTTKKKLFTLLRMFISVKEIGNIKFRYFVLRNIDKISKVISSENNLYEEIIASKLPFENDRNSLIMKLGESDGNGGAFIRPGSEELEQFIKEEEKLKETYKEVFQKYESEISDFEKILEEEIEIDELYALKSADDLAEITTEFLELLMEFSLVDN